MPPKKISKSANTDSSKTGAKTRSSAKSAPPAAAPSSADKKKTPTRSKKAQKPTEEGVEASAAVKDEGNSSVNATEEKDISGESVESWELTIKMMSGKFTVRVPPTAGVMDLKEEIFQKQGFPVENQRLMFNSKIFTENHPLTVYDVTNGSEIYYVFRMRGI